MNEQALDAFFAWPARDGNGWLEAAAWLLAIPKLVLLFGVICAGAVAMSLIAIAACIPAAIVAFVLQAIMGPTLAGEGEELFVWIARLIAAVGVVGTFVGTLLALDSVFHLSD